YSQREAWLMMTLLRVLLEGYIPGDATGNIFKCLDSPSAVTFNTSRIVALHSAAVRCTLADGSETKTGVLVNLQHMRKS
ncbi:MAG TPA: hypothetical protein VL523_05695, partial [Terriglobia bacterium]|nr:hypothetical protein [Terriglobia bacterium]